MVELQPSADLVLVGLVSAAIGIAIGYGINAFVRHRTDAMNQRRNALGNVMRTHSQNWKQQEGGGGNSVYGRFGQFFGRELRLLTK